MQDELRSMLYFRLLIGDLAIGCGRGEDLCMQGM